MLPSFSVVEPPIHDISVLPHMHGADDIERFFPLIEAAEQGANVEDWNPGEEKDDIVGKEACDQRTRGALRGRLGGRRSPTGSESRRAEN